MSHFSWISKGFLFLVDTIKWHMTLAASTQKEYYDYDWEKKGIIIIHLQENSKKKFGFAKLTARFSWRSRPGAFNHIFAKGQLVC